MKKQFSKQKIKLINRVTWASAILIAISFVIIGNLINAEEEDLLKNGIREEVIVMKKYSTGTRNSPQYAMDVDWFKVVEDIPFYKTKDTVGLSEAEKFSNDFLSKAFKDKSRKRIERLNKTVKLKFINGDTYNNINIGEIVTLVYHKEQPNDGRLLREIE